MLDGILPLSKLKLLLELGSCPTDSVLDNLNNGIVVIAADGLMAGMEIEYLTKTALEGDTAAEYVTALEPADEYYLIGSGNVEELTVHLLLVQHEVERDTLCDGMCGVNGPYVNVLTGKLSPGKVAGSAEKATEGKRSVCGVKGDKTHTLKHALAYLINYHGVYLVVKTVAPPDKNVGVVEKLVRQTVSLILLKISGSYLKIILCKSLLKEGVDTAGIDLLAIIVLLIFAVLIPNSYSDHN